MHFPQVITGHPQDNPSAVFVPGLGMVPVEYPAPRHVDNSHDAGGMPDYPTPQPTKDPDQTPPIPAKNLFANQPMVGTVEQRGQGGEPTFRMTYTSNDYFDRPLVPTTPVPREREEGERDSAKTNRMPAYTGSTI